MKSGNQKTNAPKAIRPFLFLAIGLFLTILSINGSIYYWNNYHDRFTTVTSGKVFSSAAMQLEPLGKKVKAHKIKTVIDFRGDKLQPFVDAEHAFLSRIGVTHIHIPSKQVPNEEVLDRFLSVLDNPENYPILMHCNHGEGRAVLFSSIYRIEYEGWSNEKARQATRWITYGSGFSESSSKGVFLKNYKHRRLLVKRTTHQ